MRNSFYSLMVFIIMYPSCASAQIDLKISKNEFRHGRVGFDEAWRHVLNGNSYFRKKGIWYGAAYEEYKMAEEYNNTNARLNYKTGAAALFSDKKDEAAGFLLKSIETDPEVAGDAFLLAGKALEYEGKYSEAAGPLTSFLESKVKKTRAEISEAKKHLEECSNALDILKDTLRLEITNLGPNINSGSDDYSEVFSSDLDTIFFASRRDLSVGSKSRYADGKADENIYTSDRNNGFWDIAVTAGKNLTTKYCETPLYLNKRGDSLYIYAGYESGGNILVSHLKNNHWKKPGKLPFRINSRWAETSLTISPSGGEVFFVSDRPKDNLGGKDIYFIKKMGNGKWSKPVNAGPSVNTPYNEESVRISAGGDTLWFSSKGHNSIGGYDIFYSKRDSSGGWSPAVNAGYPINTSYDELFYYPSSGHVGQFFFASNRSGGSGGLDIYSGRMLPARPQAVKSEQTVTPKPDTVIFRDTIVVVKEVPVQVNPPVRVSEKVINNGITVQGKITDAETHSPLLSKIDILDAVTGDTVTTTASSDIDGTYRIKLAKGNKYLADVRSTGYLSELKTITIPGKFEGETYNFNVSLIKVKVGKKVVLNNLFFETGKSVLTKNSYTELDHLMQILHENPLMKIEISGHTDNTGSQALNMKLSEERAKAVTDYLVLKGIDKARLTSRGYGPSQPIAPNSTSEGRSKNRRVEFKILEF